MELSTADSKLADLLPEERDDEEADRPAQAFSLDVDFDGKLYLWVRSETLDPLLIVEKEAGHLLGRDDDSGGWTTALLVLEAVSGKRLRAIVSTARGESTGSLELCALRAPESDATLAASELVDETRAEILRAQSEGDKMRALEAFNACLDEVVSVPGRVESLAVTRSLWSLDKAVDAMGEPACPVRLWSLLLEHCRLFLPPEDGMLQTARQNLGNALFNTGDLSAARPLFEAVLSVRERVLAPDSLGLAMARSNLAVTLEEQGSSRQARELFELALPVFTRSFATDSSELQLVRIDLAASRASLGDLEGALELQQSAVDALSARPDDDPSLQLARGNLASTLRELGELARARALQELVLEIDQRSLSENDPALWRSRGDLAGTVAQLGDLARARELGEETLAGLARILPSDSLELATSRHNLAAILLKLGDLQGATELEQLALEQRRAQLGESDPLTQASRYHLAEAAVVAGDLEGARAMFESGLNTLRQELPEGNPLVLATRWRLAAVRCAQGEYPVACKELAEIVGLYEGSRPSSDEDLIEARGDLAWALAGAGDRGACRQATAAFIGGLKDAVRTIILGHAAREAEERVATLGEAVSLALSLSCGAGRFESDAALERMAFELVESVREAGLLTTRLRNAAMDDPSLADMRLKAREETAELARLAARSDVTRTELTAAREALDATERHIAARVAEDPAAAELLRPMDVEALRARLDPETVLTTFWRYTRRGYASDGSASSQSALCAWIVRRDIPLARLELGPAGAVEAAVEAWRVGIDAPEAAEPVARGPVGVASTRSDETGGSRAETVKEALLGALWPRWTGAKRAILVLDDALHLVPFDALELEPGVLLGDRLEVELRPGVYEPRSSRAQTPAQDAVIAFGGIDYDAAPAALPGPADLAPSASSSSGGGHGGGGEPEFVRSGPFAAGFPALPATLVEAESIVSLGREAGKSVRIYSGAAASRANLFEVASSARWLHLATHGWFAPDSIAPDARDPSVSNSQRTRVWSRASLVRSSAPLLLCGLALSGANREHDSVGRCTGVVTAQELAHLDLRGCELAVLSACETSIGVRRAGQGVASLQRALLMAGVNSVITSLWKVPDRSTMELMTSFYRHLWVGGLTKSRALWMAKMELRSARDEHGTARYVERDWAGWVLAGDPR